MLTVHNIFRLRRRKLKLIAAAEITGLVDHTLARVVQVRAEVSWKRSRARPSKCNETRRRQSP